MARKIAGAVVLLTLFLGLAPWPSAAAATPQIEDPALDYPAPWADLVSVQLAVVKQKGRDYLSVTFTTSGEISDPSRNALTGYNFLAKVGTCELHVLWYAFPMVTEPAGFPTGSADASCGTRELGASATRKGSTVTVVMPMQDAAAKGVVRGATMTNLSAYTALVEGLAEDPTGAISKTGDTASSPKPWTVG